MAKAKLLLLGCLKLFSEVCLSSKSGNGSVRTRDNISSVRNELNNMVMEILLLL